MPTGRTVAFLIAAVLLYLFANQTQVGWLYVMSALIAGLVMISGWLNRGSVRGVGGSRQVGDVDDGELYEGDETTITLTLYGTRGLPAAHIQVTELCPIAQPENRTHTLFLPLLPAGEKIHYRYDLTLDRRGVYEFPPLPIASRAPFGFFTRKGRLQVPTRVMIYPEVRAITRFPLFDRQLAAQLVNPRSGTGSEVIGVRPYRPGDPRRGIHWRSTARTGQLVSREFAEETRPGITLVFDRHYSGQYADKRNPFEWGVKCAVTIAEYVRSRGYPLYLHVDDTRDTSEPLPVPQGAVSRDALLQYTARLTPTRRAKLPDLLSHGGGWQSFIGIVIPQPTMAVVEPLIALKGRGYNILPVLIDPATFPVPGESAQSVADTLQAAGITVKVIGFGFDWTEQFSQIETLAYRL